MWADLSALLLLLHVVYFTSCEGEKTEELAPPSLTQKPATARPINRYDKVKSTLYGTNQKKGLLDGSVRGNRRSNFQSRNPFNKKKEEVKDRRSSRPILPFLSKFQRIPVEYTPRKPKTISEQNDNRPIVSIVANRKSGLQNYKNKNLPKQRQKFSENTGGRKRTSLVNRLTSN